MTDVIVDNNSGGIEPPDKPGVNPSYVDAPYEVGKGKPPVATRFQPGGKPGPGRRKRSRTKSDFDEVFDELIPIGTDRHGRVIRKTARRVANMQLRKLVLEGNLQAIKFMKRHELRMMLARLGYLTPPPRL